MAAQTSDQAQLRRIREIRADLPGGDAEDAAATARVLNRGSRLQAAFSLMYIAASKKCAREDSNL